MPAADALPRVAPFMLRSADEMCGRRLRRMYQDLKGDDGAFLRGRVRDALVNDARAAHHELGPPNPASFVGRSDLLPEEQAVYRLAADGYLSLFGSEPARAIDHAPFEKATEGAKVRLAGWIDLVLERSDGGAELRQLELWGKELCADPLCRDSRHSNAFAVLAAAMRLEKEWLHGRDLVVRHADPIRRRVVEHVVDRAVMGEVRVRFAQRWSRIQLQADKGEVKPGQECARCAYVNGCEAHR